MDTENGLNQVVEVNHKTIRVRSDKLDFERIDDKIVVEKQIELYLNNNLYAIFSCSPYEIKELMVGHLLTSGIISGIDEIKDLSFSKGKVLIQLDRSKNNFIASQNKPRLILSSCISGLKIPPHLWMKSMKLKTDLDFKVNQRVIFEAVKILNSKASLFRLTGGTHASALLDDSGKELVFSEDIGRHNAIDKVVGKLASKHMSFKRTILASTGRLTFEMVVKLAILRIPIVVSLSSPTDKAVITAEMLGLTLIGFARGKRFNIYTGPERILI